MKLIHNILGREYREQDQSLNIVCLCVDGLQERQLADAGGFNLFIPPNGVWQKRCEPKELFEHDRVHPLQGSNAAFDMLISMDIVHHENAMKISQQMQLPTLLVHGRDLEQERPENLVVIRKQQPYNEIILFGPQAKPSEYLPHTAEAQTWEELTQIIKQHSGRHYIR